MKKTRIIAIVLAICLMCGLMMTGCGKTNRDDVDIGSNINANIDVDDSDNIDPEIVEVDPFENIYFYKSGISGYGSVSDSATLNIVLADGYEFTIDANVDISKNGSLSNGDTVHIALADWYTDEFFEENYGIVVTRTETDMVVEGLPYYINENPDEIFEYLGDRNLDNALEAIKSYAYTDHNGIDVELFGVMCYYQDEGNALNLSENEHNQIVLIYHLDNGQVPGGWYTYLAPWGDAIIRNVEDDNGVPTEEKEVALEKDEYFSISFSYYNKEHFSEAFVEWDGETYLGHRTVEECVKAFEDWMIEKNGALADHVVVDEAMKEYVTER